MKCEECRIGQYQPTLKPYMLKMGGHPVLVIKAPAYECDVCHNLFFDPGFVLNMQYLQDNGSLPLSARQTIPSRTPKGWYNTDSMKSHF